MNVRADKQALADWADFRAAILSATTVDVQEGPEQRKRRVTQLQDTPEAWFKYYFPNFYYAAPAPFHLRASRRVLNNPEWYEVRAWSRELAKSSRSMMEDLYLLLTSKKRYKLLVSNSYDNACRLLMPYLLNLESNNRIVNDYGIQERPGSWTEGDFTTRSGFSIRALGAGQSPRGTRKNEQRPDIIEFDDFDTDEECRNPDIIDKKFKWVNEAVIPTKSISTPTLIRWNGNVIAEDCCIVRSMEFADHVDRVNIRDAQGKSTWPEKNTEEKIDRTLAILPYSAQQKEYYNNPLREGSVFKNLSDKPLPRLQDYPFVVCYIDPSYKDSKRNDYKACVLVGPYKGERHVIKSFCQQTTTANMVEWLYTMESVVGSRTAIYYYIERNNNEDEIKRQLFLASGQHGGKVLPVTFDDRAKAEKFTRIESTLEPLDRNGQLYFNETEKDNPDMKVLKSQFKAFAPGSRAHDDGPDAVEGAVYIINNKEDVLALGTVTRIKRKANAKKF
jgi:predicted phage terminase large subunit-like protein